MYLYLKRVFTCLIFLSFFIGGCSTRVAVRKSGGPLFIPAGVDSVVAAEADSLAEDLFVSIAEEKKADELKNKGQNKVAYSDTLWKYLSMVKDTSSLKVTPEDSLAAIEEFNKAALKLREFATKKQAGVDEESVKEEIYALLEEARSFFEKSIVLNPFDLEAKNGLATVYKLLALRFGEIQNYEKSIQVLENLVRIEKGEHILFARLGENYWQVKDWQSSYRNFAQAENILAGLSFIAPPDTGQLFLYVYYQGDTQAKMHNADSALYHFNRAIAFAPNNEQVEKIQSYIDWINWDDGNIAASERKDEISQLEKNSEYTKAAKGYAKLIPDLTTQKAENEIQWRLSLLEFQFLEKEEQGIDRLYSVIKLLDYNKDGNTIDSLDQRYFESYGAMCHNLGLENEKKNRKAALAYFLQSISIKWKSRAKSLLELAKLSKNNPDKVIEYSNDALTTTSQLDKEEAVQIYQLLVEAYKRKGMFEEARVAYQKGLELRKGTK